MASPPDPITTVNGRRCTRVLRSSTLLADNTATSPATSTAAAPGTQTSVAAPLSSTEAASLPAPTQPSTVLPSSFIALATTATGSVGFTQSSALQSASSAALNTFPPSTLPTSLQQAGSSDTSTAVVSVISSSTVAVLQPTAASQSTIPSVVGGNQGSSTSGSDGSSTSGGDGTSKGTGDAGGSVSPGAVAGISIGIVLGIIGIVALILFCMRRRNIRKDKRLHEKSQGGEGGFAGSQTRPLSVVAAKWAAFTAGLKPNNDSLARRAPESPAFEPLTRPSYSTEGSTRQSRSASAPTRPPATRFASFKQKFKPQHDIIIERRSRAMSNDTVPSFYSPRPPQLSELGDLSDSLNPFRDSKPLHYRITNPDSEMSPGLPTPRTQRGPLTPGSARWREPTPDFAFPAGTTSTNPFADPSNRSSGGSVPDARRSDVSMPPLARVVSHARTQSSNTNPASITRASRARSSWYSVDSGYNSPHHASALVPPLRPTQNPFHDRYAAEIDAAQQKEANSASIYIPPSSQHAKSNSGKGPGTIPMPSRATLTVEAAMERAPFPTTSTNRSSWLLPQDSPASSYNARPGISRNSSKDSRPSRATRGKSDPFDLDRPEVLAVASNYDPDEALAKPRYSNGSDWWRGIVDEGAGSASTVGLTR